MSKPYFSADFKQELLDWAKEKDVVWINPYAMVHFLMQKPEVQKFIEDTGVNFYTLQQQVDAAHENNQSGRRAATEEYPERLAKYDNNNPSIDTYDFGKASNLIAQLNQKPDVVDMFAATIEACNHNLLGGLGDLIESSGLQNACARRLEEKGWVDKYKNLKNKQFTHPSGASAPLDLLAALSKPEVQALLKDTIAAGVQQGMEAHEEKQAKGMSDGMSKGWTGKV